MNPRPLAFASVLAIAIGVGAFVLWPKPSPPEHGQVCDHLVEIGARTDDERARCEFFFGFVHQTFDAADDPLWLELRGCLLGAEDTESAESCTREEIAVLGHVSTYFGEGDGAVFCEVLADVYCASHLYDCDRWTSFTTSPECTEQYAQDLGMRALAVSETRGEFDRWMAAAWACADADEHQEVGACVNDWLIDIDETAEDRDIDDTEPTFATPSEREVCEHIMQVATEELGESSVLNGGTPTAWLDECVRSAQDESRECANYEEILRCTVEGEAVSDFEYCRSICQPL